MDVCANTSGVYISKRGDQVASGEITRESCHPRQSKLLMKPATAGRVQVSRPDMHLS